MHIFIYDLCKTVSIFPIILSKKKNKKKNEKYFNEYESYFTAVKIIFRTIKKSYSIPNVCIYKQIIGRLLNEEKGILQ